MNSSTISLPNACLFQLSSIIFESFSKYRTLLQMSLLFLIVLNVGKFLRIILYEWHTAALYLSCKMTWHKNVNDLLQENSGIWRQHILFTLRPISISSSSTVEEKQCKSIITESEKEIKIFPKPLQLAWGEACHHLFILSERKL